jgi:Domain of unknown function (DUF4907)
MKRIYLLFSHIVIFISADAQVLPTKPTKKELAKIKTANIKKATATQLQYFIIKADSGTYGYSIYANGNLYIQQTTIPAMAGSVGFNDTLSAATIAKLTIQKIKQGEMPPTITVDDLKKANITNGITQKL